MRIVHVYDGHERVHEGRGSVPDVVWNNARYAAAAGHDVWVLERQWDGLGNAATHEDVRFRRFRLPTGARTPWTDVPYEMVGDPVGTVKLVADRTAFALAAIRHLPDDADVIHVHLPFAANVLVTVAPWLRSRMVYTAHLGETEKRVTEPRFSPDAYLAARVARTVVLNPGMRRAFVDRGVPASRLRVVPNGVDTGRFDAVPDERRRAVADRYDLADRTVVLFVGTVTPRKGVLDLVAATERAFADRDDVAVVVTGKDDLDPAYAEEVREAIADADLGDTVTLTGFVSTADLEALYDLADVFVLPSYEEGSSVAVTEALAAGLPVVGTRIPGIEQQIEHGRHGFLGDPGDVGTLADNLQWLVDDDSIRATHTEASRERAAALSWPSVTDQLLDVYREVAEA